MPLTGCGWCCESAAYTHQQERQERAPWRELAHTGGVHAQFFSKANELPSSPPCELLADRRLVEALPGRVRDTWATCPRLTPTTSGAVPGRRVRGHSALQRRPGRHAPPASCGALRRRL
ncbi:hypothetical protein GWK47_004093 [Chionoecetes opilio]|uniref:Uncharacterized protein n=1 Tax=Chionoecetes opilio TaxID=41210 RepID=A0A8J4YFF9_CHIOP|nr:hypothetical protein GWK47_004093 [Chionoecetes opilio]